MERSDSHDGLVRRASYTSAVKIRTVATCQSCGAQMPRWMGRCPECAAWGTVVEEPVGDARAPARVDAKTHLLVSHSPDEAARVPTGIEELDRVLGGGVVEASI